MGLLVTIFLVLVNVYTDVLSQQPTARGMTALSFWLLSCIVAVFGCLVAYAAVLVVYFHFGAKVTKICHREHFNGSNMYAGGSCSVIKIDYAFMIIMPLLFAVINLYYWVCSL